MPTPTSDLRRMQAIALALLVAAAAAYALAVVLEARHPAFGWLAAFAEAAMVGAIADWFAVVALFRHPLGLPIPHTAIIPRQKDRIGARLADFICAHFLATGQVLAKLQQFGAAGRLAGWLGDPARSRAAAAQLAGVLDPILAALDEPATRQRFGRAALSRLGALDAAGWAGRLLALLTAEGRHQGLVDAVLRRLVGVLDDDALKAQVARAIAGEVNVLRLVGLDEAVARYATTKLVAGIGRLVDEMAADRSHPLRAQLDAWWAGFVRRLGDEPALRAEVAALQRELLGQPALGAYLESLWSDLVAQARADLARGADSRLAGRIDAALGTLGARLAADPALRAWLDAQLAAAAPRWIERYREDIRAYIADRVAGWDAREMTAELERHVGRDLQFIRINGTLVGGLVGLAIHAATVALR